MIRTDIIQLLINKTKTRSYLEIGMGSGLNFHTIQCEHKVCVDPNPTTPVTHVMTSDDFFAQNQENYGVIFIDGLHLAEQVYRDVINSLNVLEDGGFIVCHDINPYCELIQIYPQPIPNSEWTGDCWKAWVQLRAERKDLSMFVVDTDYGCGIITKGNQTLLQLNQQLTWDLLDSRRVELLNLISTDQFLQLYA